MSDEMRRVVDEAAIRRVIDRYCHAVKGNSKRMFACADNDVQLGRPLNAQ